MWRNRVVFLQFETLVLFIKHIWEWLKQKEKRYSSCWFKVILASLLSTKPSSVIFMTVGKISSYCCWTILMLCYGSPLREAIEYSLTWLQKTIVFINTILNALLLKILLTLCTFCPILTDTVFKLRNISTFSLLSCLLSLKIV